MEQLLKDGWNINETQVSQFFDDEILPKSTQDILKTILNEDIRHFGETAIINKKEETVFEGPCVLQLLRYRNVSVPRIKEELNQTDPAHSLIRLFLTDGHTSISALLLNSIPGITSETPPGTKIQIIGTVPIESNFLILDRKNVKILGGRVEEMIEKWNVEKSSVRADGFKSSVGKATGAPKWVSFGRRGQKKGEEVEKGFKANHVMPKTLKEENDDFSKNRAEIIKEIQESDSTKTFAKPNLAPPPQKPPSKDPLPPKIPKERKERKPMRRGRKNSEDGPDVDVGEYANHKPSGPATLFDFIGGEEKEIVEATTKMSIGRDSEHGIGSEKTRPSDRPSTGLRGKPEFQGSRNFNKGGVSNPRGNQNQGGSYPRGSDQGRGNQGAPRGTKDQGGDQNPRGKQNHGGSNQRGSQGSKGNQYQGGGQNPRGSDHGGAQRGNQNQGSSLNPRGNQNHEGGSNPRGTQNHGGGQNPRGSDQGALQRGNQNDGGGQNPRGIQNFQQNQGPPRGNQGYNQNQGPQNPRGNQNQGGVPNPRGFQNQGAAPFIPRGNFQPTHAPPPRGTQGFHQNQGQRGNQGYQNQGGGNPRGSHESQIQIGSQCMATWTDGNLYPATIIELTPNRHAVVRYNQYGNTQSIPVDFLIFS